MFTPQQKKGWSSGWSLSPANPRGSAAAALGKGKGVAEAAPPPPPPPLPAPPHASLGENGVDGEAEVWRRFRDAGLLDESSLQRKDREALAHRISELDKELHEYQYNMGLLLIEKKEWTAKYEEMRQGLVEAEEILKREQTAHAIAITELEKREENIRKALGIEKQCVVDLEKALREMRSEMAEVKFTSEKKLAEAHALEASLEEKRLEIEAKLHSADARLAEASRKSSQAARKLEDLEARERKLEKEKLSFDTERKTREKHLTEQAEHLRDWELKLQESQNRLVEGQRSLNDRDERANEKDRALKKKQDELEETRKTIEAMKSSLKRMEDDISTRLHALTAKEKDMETRFANLEVKEKELAAKEEMLNERERVGLQKLLDDHNAILESKRKEFDLELQKEKISFDEEMKEKINAVEKKNNEISRKEDQIAKREHTLDSKMQKLKDKEKDLEAKSKAMKKWEESVKGEDRKVVEEKERLEREKQQLENSKSELERLKALVEAEKQQIIKERENLKLTEEEREQHFLLTSRLKQEIEEYKMHNDSISRESEDLREQREKFEKEWEVLDEKRVALEAEIKKIDEEREKFDKWRHNEEERLNNMELEIEAKCWRELEELRLRKEAFEREMQHEKSEIEELLKRERANNDRNLQLHKHELDMEMERKLIEKEKEMQELESELKKKIDFEENKIRYAIDLNESKIQKIKMEKEQLRREAEALLEDKQKLEVDRTEIKKDIDSLSVLSRNLKDRREEYVKERTRFLALAEQCRVCKNCGVKVIDDLDILGLQDTGNVQMPNLAFEEQLKSPIAEASPAGTSLNTNSGGRMSWLQKCSRLFNFSPTGKGAEKSTEIEAEPTSFVERLDGEVSEGEADYEPTPSYGIAIDSLDKDGNEPEPEPSYGVADNSTDILRIQSENGGNVPSLDQDNEREESSLPVDNNQPESSKRKGGRPPKRRTTSKGVRRTRSVKAVVEDAKAILGETSEGNNDYGDSKGFSNIQEESQEESVHTELGATSTGKKRRFDNLSGMKAAEGDAEDSEVHSESVSVGGGRRKRRQTSRPAVAQVPGEKRYNFRRSTIAGAATAAHAVPNQTKGQNKGGHKQLQENEVDNSRGEGEATSERNVNMAQSVVEVHEFAQNVVQLEIAETHTVERLAVDGTAATAIEAEIEPSTPVGSELGIEQDEDDDDDDDEDEDEAAEEKHNASIGKKLWTFFTT
ncbi:protein CROWDED NUCLEI 1-like isoform X2 [Ananas comosus]|uniref:Protein CROWDED NUCLEI 1-like isoform X2 n=1 Tax=Ananas comosus TaxID=4615 RepID=A0A6P5EX95_ANACO|nr:protein CROWDED NUCLEI 1-like isoform X2 [Ananas comosus]